VAQYRFSSALFFLPSHQEAKWVLAVYVLSFPVGFLVFHYTRNIRLTGIPHILFWMPLLVYILLAARRDPAFSFVSLYAVWIVPLGFTIAASVVLDVKAVLAVLNQDGRA
jgi:hypothetical protein